MQYLHYAPSCSNLCIHCIGGCGCVCLFVVCLCCLRSSLLVVVVVGSRDEDDQVKRKLCVFTRLQFISVVSCYCWGSIQTCMVRCKREREREVPFSPQGRFLKVCADKHTHTRSHQSLAVGYVHLQTRFIFHTTGLGRDWKMAEKLEREIGLNSWKRSKMKEKIGYNAWKNPKLGERRVVWYRNAPGRRTETGAREHRVHETRYRLTGRERERERMRLSRKIRWWCSLSALHER